MRRGLVTLAAAAALTAPATATADYLPADSYPQLAGALEVARAAWPDSPCRGREMVSFEPAGAFGTFRHPSGHTPWGAAYIDACAVQVSDALTGYGLCEILVHEFGHLAGHGHSLDARSVMAPAPTGTYEPCHATLPPITRADVRATVLADPTVRAEVARGARIGRCRTTGHSTGKCRMKKRGEWTPAAIRVHRLYDRLVVVGRS